MFWKIILLFQHHQFTTLPWVSHTSKAMCLILDLQYTWLGHVFVMNCHVEFSINWLMCKYMCLPFARDETIFCPNVMFLQINVKLELFSLASQNYQDHLRIIFSHFQIFLRNFPFCLLEFYCHRTYLVYAHCISVFSNSSFLRDKSDFCCYKFQLAFSFSWIPADKLIIFHHTTSSMTFR